MESQSHGFKVEDIIINSITGLKNQKELKKHLKGNFSYTQEHDIPKGYYPKTNLKNNIQIKTCKVKNNTYTIGLGDYTRNYLSMKSGDNKKIIVCLFEQNKNFKIFYKVIEIDWHKDMIDKCYLIPDKNINEFVSYVKNIPPGKENQKKNKNIWKQKRDILFKKYGNQICKINAKIDSGNQRRVQSSIKSSDVKYFTHKEYTKEFNGLKLPFKIKSETRSFNVKK